MLKVIGYNDNKVMRGLDFHDDGSDRPILEGEHLQVEARSGKGKFVEVHIVHTEQRVGKRPVRRMMYLTFEPESFRALQALLNSLELPEAPESPEENIADLVGKLVVLSESPTRQPLINAMFTGRNKEA